FEIPIAPPQLAMGSMDNFAWSEVSPGRWERDIDEIENFYLALDRQYAETGRHYFAIMGHVSISMEVPSHQQSEVCERELERALQAAWVRLRFDHPTIASWVEYTGRQPRKVYECGGPQPDRQESLENWLDSTFRSVSTNMTGLEWCNADQPLPALSTLFV
ncbi:563_t:CDS:1, partial [Scutellospora calospora]